MHVQGDFVVRVLGLLRWGVIAAVAAVAAPANAGFTPYVIRNASGTDNAPVIVDNGSTIEFFITEAGQKAGLGSNDVNGAKLSQIFNLRIDRLDDLSRFSVGSGPYVAPYLNIWITDGLGHYAVVANEPSDPAFFLALYNVGPDKASYDLDFADLAGMRAKIFETDDTSWLPNGGVNLTFADLADFIIDAPDFASLTGTTSGAPRELGTNATFGVNWIFGDSLANYVAGQNSYIVANASVQAPEPEALALFALGLAAFAAAGYARRKQG